MNLVGEKINTDEAKCRSFDVKELHGAIAGTQKATTLLNELRSLEFGGPGQSVKTQSATTERQRALQALQNSTMNARQFVGAEAALLHS